MPGGANWWRTAVAPAPSDGPARIHLPVAAAGHARR